MEVALSAFLGEIAHRSVSFFIDKLSKEASTLPIDENLHGKLLRIRIIVEEAEIRQIRNQTMLDQLKVLRESMYKGYYVLDNFKYRSYKEDSNKDDHLVSRSFSLSRFNPAKRIHLCKGSVHKDQLHQLLGSLEILITDVNEFVLFLNACPPLHRQLYSTYLVLNKCMFGRHVEVESIINFLMQKRSPGGTGNLDVLPIVGPEKAGKSTLIEHVCNDERLHNAFSRVLLFTEDSLDGRLDSVRDSGTIKHQNHAQERERFLVIIEIDGDMKEGTWDRLYSACERYAANGTKIIISSRSPRIARFGTAPTVKVEYLRQEEYWYFFKTLAFGSTDPKEEPKLASMAMQMAICLNSSFIIGNIVASMLRANFSAKFWSMVLSWIEAVSQRYSFLFGARPESPQNLKQAYLPRINGSGKYWSIYNDYHIVSAHGEDQMINFQDILSGGVLPYGKFDVLTWRSSVPPYYSYILSCEVHRSTELDLQKKYSRKGSH